MFTIGCDPEFFLKDSKGNFVPAFGTLGGTKKEPRVLECGHTVQEDGCALEIGTRPASTADEFVLYVKEAMEEVTALLKPLKLSPAIVSEAKFTDEQLMNPLGWEVGCDPDYDAYSGNMRVMKDYTDTTRYAGGHIHVGSDLLLNPKHAAHYVMALDATLGYKLARAEKMHTRATVYGGPGKFRYKPYGIEYRSPSNVWLRSEALQRKVFDTCATMHLHLLHKGDAHRRAMNNYDGLLDAMSTGKRSEYFEEVLKRYAV